MATKLVNIYAPIAIRTVKPPVCGRMNNVTMSLMDILKCLHSRATIEEVLPDGTTVKLTTKNYRDDHSHLVKLSEEVVEAVEQTQNDIKDAIQPITEVKEMVTDPVVLEDAPSVEVEVDENNIVEEIQIEEDSSVDEAAECDTAAVDVENDETIEVTEDKPTPKKNTSSNNKKKKNTK